MIITSKQTLHSNEPINAPYLRSTSIVKRLTVFIFF